MPTGKEKKAGNFIKKTAMELEDWNTMEDLIYVLDSNLDLVRSNDSWRRFAAENNGERLLQQSAGINALKSMSGGHKVRWEALYSALLNGQLAHHREKFSCPSPTERRTYELTVTPLTAASGAVEFLEHRAHLLSTGPALMTLHDEKSIDWDEPEQAPGSQLLNASAFTRPLEGVGGDLVWLRRESASRGWFLIADAMGHDARAEAAALQLRDIVAQNLSGTPKSVIEEANRAFILARPDDDDAMFVTGILFRIDLDVHEMRVCVFGHHGFLTTKNGIMEMSGGMPVGILMEAPPWPEHIIDTRTLGARAMAFTDGLFEQFNSQGEMYTIDRIAAKFLETMDVPLSESIRQIIQSIDDFRNGAGIKDDQSVLGFEIAI